MSFSLPKYAALLDGLSRSKKPFLPIADFLREPNSKSIILRHDVDRRPERSIAIASIEAERGIRAVYYFRVTKIGAFPKDAVKKISDMGHECGYHYEVLSDCKGNWNEADKLFRLNLVRLRNITTIKTISMHGAPLSPYKNQDFGDKLDFSEHNLLGDGVRSIEPHDPIYFTDTGGRWANNATNLRDRVGTNIAKLQPDEPGFFDYVQHTNRPIYISTHPERWPSSTAGRLQAKAQDKGVNTVKYIIRTVRNL